MANEKVELEVELENFTIESFYSREPMKERIEAAGGIYCGRVEVPNPFTEMPMWIHVYRAEKELSIRQHL